MSEATIRIFAKKSFRFRLYEGFETQDGSRTQKAVKTVVTTPLAFQIVPAWVQQDALFEWAVSDGDIEVVISQSQEHDIEMDSTANQKTGNRVRTENLIKATS